MKFEFLGTSDTGGIPLLGCYCAVCEEARAQKTHNRSTSAYLTLGDGSVILFDAGYDFLSEKFNTTPIRAIFLTHFHADHCLGLIRLRKSPIPIICYIPEDTQGFGDLFVHKDSIEYQTLLPFESIEIQGVKITALTLEHSKPTNGYVIQTPTSKVAYLTDCGLIPADSLEFLKQNKIEHLFLDACYTPEFTSKKHLNWENASEYMKQIAPNKGYFIHASCKTLSSLSQRAIKLKFPYISQGFKVEV